MPQDHTTEEQLEFERIIGQPEFEEVRQVITSFEQRGIAQGIEQGIVRGKRDVLRRLLQSRFGELPEGVAAKIEAIPSAELDALLDRVLAAPTLEAMGLDRASADGDR